MRDCGPLEPPARCVLACVWGGWGEHGFIQRVRAGPEVEAAGGRVLGGSRLFPLLFL